MIPFYVVPLNQTNQVRTYLARHGFKTLGQLLWRHNQRVREILPDLHPGIASVVVTGNDDLVVSQYNKGTAITVEVCTRHEWTQVDVEEYTRNPPARVDILV